MSPAKPAGLDSKLKAQMQALGIQSYRQLAEQAKVSRGQVNRLRHGHVTQMRLEKLLQLCDALQISLQTLLSWCQAVRALPDSAALPAPNSRHPLTDKAIAQEYEQLQQRLQQQHDRLLVAFQAESLDRLESWLKNWPKVIQAIQTDQPDLPLIKVMALLKPFEQLLADWAVAPIGKIGAVVDYDPRCHVLLNGQAQPGESVRVSRPGYRHHEKLLHRAEVMRLK